MSDDIYTDSCYVIDNECTSEIVYVPTECNCYDAPDWLRVIETFGNDKEYDIHNYNCVDFSRDLTEELRKMGYDAHQIHGKCKDIVPDPTISHAWVRICFDFEPQTGEYITGLCEENN
jgi:hypothetical protein